MNEVSTDMEAKRTTVMARLKQLLRLVAITALAMLVMIVLHLPTGQPATSTSQGVVLLMLAALFAASLLIAFHFDFWFLAPLLNAAALLLSLIVLEHGVSQRLHAAVFITTLLFLAAVCVYAYIETWRGRSDALARTPAAPKAEEA